MIQTLAALLPIGMAFLMLTLGLRLDLRAVGAALRRPKALLAGLGVQVVMLPLLAALLARAVGLEPVLAAGLMLVAASPGGITSNYIAHLARGDLALSVTMTLITTLLVPVSLPMVLALAGMTPPSAAALMGIGVKMTAVAVVPLLLGLAVQGGAPVMAARLRPGFELAAKGVFAALVLATFAQNAPAMRDHFAALGLPVILLNLGALALGAGVPWVLRLTAESRRAIMVEASLQNVAITIFVAGAVLGEPALSVPGLIYAVVMNVTALALLGMGRRAGAQAA